MSMRRSPPWGRPSATWPAASVLAVVAGALLSIVNPAAGQMGGLYLPETGGPINGTAQAGSAAVARDAQTAWLNPAGMTRLDSPQLLFTLMPFVLDIQFNPSSATTIAGSDGGQQGGFIPDGAFFLAAPINEHVALGFSIASPGGMAIDPEDNWVGRNWTIESKLLALNFEPSIGARLTEQWSVGAGLDVQYLKFSQDLIGPLAGNRLDIDGRNWNVGFSASVLWEPLETTRFGLRYRSQITHELSGDLTVDSPTPVSTSFTMPMSLTLSAYHDFNEHFALLADFGWTNWNAFDKNIITFDGAGASTEVPRNFRDTWNVSVGAHIRPDERWLIMCGGGWVSSAVSDANRTPDLPVDQQVRASVGVEYKINDQWSVGGNYTFAWLGNNDISQTMPISGDMVGDYNAFAHIIGLYGSVKF
jgi:long-chain fatty acid transport protein